MLIQVEEPTPRAQRAAESMQAQTEAQLQAHLATVLRLRIAARARMLAAYRGGSPLQLFAEATQLESEWLVKAAMTGRELARRDLEEREDEYREAAMRG